MAPDAYTSPLVRTVESRAPEIDGLVDGAAIGWDLDRMAVVDRNVLRLAVAELLDFPDVPTAVILNEAVELASAYSTDDSGRFVNGILATLAARFAERPRVGGRRPADAGWPATASGRPSDGYSRILTVKRVL